VLVKFIYFHDDKNSTLAYMPGRRKDGMSTLNALLPFRQLKKLTGKAVKQEEYDKHKEFK